MIIYVGENGNPAKHLVIIKHNDKLGLMLTPQTRVRRDYGGRYAIDNGAFFCWLHNIGFNANAFYNLMAKYPHPDFVVIPDILMAGERSLNFSMQWREKLPDNLNYYLAVQDGMIPEMIPESLVNRIKGIFVGGSKKWKFATTEAWTDYAHGRNLKVHVGRIGTLKNLLWAESLQVDSIDSVNFARNERNWNELMDRLGIKDQWNELLYMLQIRECLT